MKNFMLTMTAIAVMTMIGFVGQAVAEVTVVSWGGAYTMTVSYTHLTLPTNREV